MKVRRKRQREARKEECGREKWGNRIEGEGAQGSF